MKNRFCFISAIMIAVVGLLALVPRAQAQAQVYWTYSPDSNLITNASQLSTNSIQVMSGDAYTDIRMVVNKTTTMNKENTYDRYFFCLSEFGIFRAKQTDSIPEPDTTQVNIAFIGNSITYGATLSNPTTQCPPRRVQEILQAQGLTVNYINCAVSGYTTFHFLPVSPQSDGTGTRHAYVVDAIKSLSKNPGKLFVLIMLGTNDSAERNTLGAPVSTDTYYNNMKAIIDDIFSYNKDANVIVNYPIWYSPNTHNGATYLQAGLNRLKSYHPVIDSLVNYYQTQTVRRVFAGNKAAFTFFENNTAYLTAESGYSGTFYLHPNAEGAKRLASFWAGSIMQHLSDTIRVDNSDESYLLLDSAVQTVSDCFEYSYDVNVNPDYLKHSLPSGIYIVGNKKMILE